MSTPPTPPDPAEIWALLREFTDRHSPRHELRRTLGHGLGKGRKKTMVLLLLADGPLSLGEIADAQGIDRPYATAIVDQLEEQSLAERTADPADRRRKLVALTPTGQAAAAVAEEIVRTPPDVLGALPPADLATLHRILTHLLPEPTAPAESPH